jgi:hypothetical protein
MVPRCVLVIVVMLAASAVSSGGDGKTPPLQSRLKIKVKEAVRAKDGTIWVDLTFTNTTGNAQKFSNSEYRFAILDKNGEQVDLCFLTPEVRDVVLKGKATTDTQPAHAPEMKPGQEFFLVVSVRNLTAQTTFRSK